MGDMVGIKALFDSAMVSTAAAVDPISVLVQSARTRGDRHQDVLHRISAFGEDLIPRIEHQGVGALLEWWLICGLGHRGSASLAFTPAVHELGLPEPLANAVETLLQHRSDADGMPILDWVVARRHFDTTMAQLKSKLFFSKTDEERNSSDNRTWTEMVDEYQFVADELTSGRIPDDPGWKMNDFARFLRKTSVWGSSTLEKNFKSRGVEVAQLAATAIEQARALTPFSLSIESRPVGRGNLDAVDAELRPIVSLLLADLVDAEIDTETPAVQAIAHGVGELSTIERNRLVMAGIDWLAGSPVEAADVNNSMSRYLKFSEAARTKQERGVDVDMILLYLDAGQFNDAEQALAAIDEEIRQRNTETELRSRCTTVERALNEANDEQGVDPEWVAAQLAELTVIRNRIGQVERTEIHTALTAIERELDNQRAESRAELAREIIEELRLIDDPDLVEVTDRYADDLANGRITRDTMLELESQLEAGRIELNRRFDRLAGQFIGLLYEVDEQLSAGLLQEAKQLEEEINGTDNASPESSTLVQLVHRITFVRQRIETSVLRTWSPDDGEPELVDHIVAYVCERAGFTEFDVRRFHTSLKSKRFVVLAGLTGTGKSTLARLYAESLDISADNDQFVRVAVRPNWIDQSEVLGYINPINNTFQPGWLASMMLRCRRNPNRLHVCLLDEMNLAPVEQYLADVLSAIEEEGSGATPRVSLYPVDARPENRDEWSPTLTLPSNLFFVGTVNIDESTRALTDRVVDRGHMIQLTVTVGREHHREPKERLEPRWRVDHKDWSEICSREPDPTNHDFLISVAETLQKMRIGMGVRTHIEIERFLSNADGVMEPDDALDVAMLQRLIPKVRGYRRNLAEPLQELLELCRDVGADRCERVIEHWLDETRGDDEYLDGTDPFLGVVTS